MNRLPYPAVIQARPMGAPGLGLTVRGPERADVQGGASPLGQVSAAGRLSEMSSRQSTPPSASDEHPERLLWVDQARQRMYIYEHWGLVRVIRVSTGMRTTSTLTRAWVGAVGVDKGAGDVDGGLLADYKWFLFRDMYGNILIHSTPYTITQGLKSYDQPAALGVRPSSHGCVRVSPEDARWLREWDPVGVAIVITPWRGKAQPQTDGSSQ